MITYIKDLIDSHSKNSSKRAIALYTTILYGLLHIVLFVGFFIDKTTATELLLLGASDVAFIGTLVGIASHQSNTRAKLDNTKIEE